MISVQRGFSCCVTTGSFSFITRVCCCSLQTFPTAAWSDTCSGCWVLYLVEQMQALGVAAGVFTCRVMQSFSFQGVLLLQCWQCKSSPSSCQDCVLLLSRCSFLELYQLHLFSCMLRLIVGCVSFFFPSVVLLHCFKLSFLKTGFLQLA